MKLKNKKILIAGLGVSGAACARFLKKRDANVTVTDMASEKEIGLYASMMHGEGIKTELGCHKIETFENADLIILSPGVPHTIPQVKMAKEKKIPVWGEIELAFRFIAEPIIAVTGTNGKTTTTTLLGKMLKKSGFKVFVGGNIGNPLIEYAGQKEKADIVVAELSSFQLDTIDRFRPHISVLLNISEDHLERYSDINSYARSKGRIFENQEKEDIAILNASDLLVKKITKKIKPVKNFFNKAVNNSGKEINNNNDLNDTVKSKFDFSEFSLKGIHNLENAFAAAMAATAANGTIDGIQSALNDFTGLPHRLEHIATIDNISFFDDSKATNVDAVKRALEAFEKPVVLIMGGRDKGGSYKDLAEYGHNSIRQLIIMGEAKEKIEFELGKLIPVQSVASMDEAVVTACCYAKPGDAVLLSPACSSFDMFESYAHRGKMFQQAVLKLGDNT